MANPNALNVIFPQISRRLPPPVATNGPPKIADANCGLGHFNPGRRFDHHPTQLGRGRKPIW